MNGIDMNSNDRIANDILSDITIHMKYAKYIPSLNRRETWEELVTRNMDMHIKKFPQLEQEIRDNYKFVYSKKVLPSMRSMQFAGKPIEISPSRMYNCAFAPINDYRVFSEIMFLLLGGTGMGYSVQIHHVEQLPEIRKPAVGKTRRFLIGDSIEGWSDSILVLMKAYFFGGSKPLFDFRDIRQKGARLVTSGGKAPGPQPLKECLMKIEGILESKKNGDKLTPLECHDIVCYIADAVLAGGIRRAALLCLFSATDTEMLGCKAGDWWEKNPQRGRANNSVNLMRYKISKEYFMEVWERVKKSGSGEPGIYFSNDKEFGCNPCKPLDATILTTNGYITFKEALELDSLEIINGDGKICQASKPFLTGENKDVFEVTMSNGHVLLGTENHLHLNQKGKWIRMDELKIGDRLKIGNSNHYTFSFTNHDEFNKGLLHGWMLGDGWNYKRGDSPTSYRGGLCFGNHEFDVIPLFEKLTGCTAVSHIQKPDTCKVLTVPQTLIEIKDKCILPFTKSKDYKLGFIKALFTADGSVRNKTNCVELYSIDKKILVGVSQILQEFGIRSSIVIHNNKKSYIAKDGKTRNNKTCFALLVAAGQYKRIGFLSEKKQTLLDKQEDKGLYRRKDFETVKFINNRGPEDVYDIFVQDESHSFIDSGFISHNCNEVSLRPFQFCNLVEINGGTIENQEDFNARAKAAAFIGTLQASYTDFHYLRPIWQRTTEKEALLGVSLTGISSGIVLKLNMKEAARAVKAENKYVASLIGINPAARLTVVKPAGTTSLVLGTSSGIHAWHNDYYIRRMRVGKNEPIYTYLSIYHPNLIEDEYFRPHDTAVISIPQRAPEGAILRTESAISLLERIRKVHNDWIKPGHVGGSNTHNVSATVSIKPEEWESVAEWMWEHRDAYNGLSVLPYSDHTYVQAPFEDRAE